MERTFLYNRGLFTLNSTALKTQVRAVAFSIAVKRKVKSSILKDCKFKQLAEITGTTEFQAKVHFNNLCEMGLLTLSEKNGHNYWKFESLKASKIDSKLRYKNKPAGREFVVRYNPNDRNDSIVVSDVMDYEDIVKALYASIIRNSSLQRLDLKNTANMADSENAKTLKDVKRAKGLKRKTSVDFLSRVKSMDMGMSFSFLCQKLNVNVRELSEIIKFGETHKYFIRMRRRIRHKVGSAFVNAWYKGLDDFGCKYAKGDYIYQQESNVYYPIYGNKNLNALAREMYDTDVMNLCLLNHR